MPYNRLTDGGVLSASQQNQNWTDMETLSQVTGGYCVLTGLTLSAGTGLSASVASGKAAIKKIVEKSASTVTGLPPSATTYIWLRDDGVFTQTASLTPPSGAHCLLGSVTTGASTVTGVDSGIAWKGARVEGDTKHVIGPNALTVYLNAARVGIGTNSPSDELHVSGIARMDAIALPERASDPASVSNRGFIYVKDVSGEAELFYRSDGGVSVQLTSGGAIAELAYLALTGGTMAGDIDMDNSSIIGLAAAAANGEAVRYEQMLAHSVARFLAWASTALTIISGNTTYIPLTVLAANATEANTQLALYDQSFTFRNLRVVVASNSISAATTLTLRDDGSDTSMTVSIPANTTGVFEDTTNHPVVAAGSLVNFKVVGGTGGTSLTLRSVQCEAVTI